MRGGWRHPSFFPWSRLPRHFFSYPRARSQVLGSLQNAVGRRLRLLGAPGRSRKSGSTPSMRALHAQEFAPPASLGSSMFPCISGVVSGFDTPPPHFPVATCGLTPLLCVMFRLMREYVAGGMPRFGREVKKLLAFVFLFMRIFRPGTTLAGVLDTSSPPQRFPACPVSLESTAPWWGRIWGGSW